MAQGQIFRANASDQPAWSTATYPDTAGTSGNVLTSDGTNWVSSAAPTNNFVNGYLTTLTGNPLDSTTYYMAQNVQFAGITTSPTQQLQRVTPVSYTLTKVYGVIRVLGTLGSAENCTVFIRKNDTTNTNITTTLQLTAIENTFSNTGLSISLSAGDFITFGFTGPAWATNPTTVGFAIGWSQ